MPTLLCALAPMLFGAGMATLLLPWLFYRARRPWPEHAHQRTSTATRDSTILWLTPACESALGERARPGRLRRMSPRCVAELLHARLPEAQWPTDMQIATWGPQADLICRGRYGELQIYQRTLNERHASGHPPEPPEPPAGSGHRRHLLISWIGLLLILLSLLLFYVARNRGWCAAPAASSPACPPPVTHPVEQTVVLNANWIFQYNTAFEYTPAHKAILDETLKNVFKDRREITISSIAAHNDPIGSDAFNRKLATERREYVWQAIRELAQTPAMRGRFHLQQTAPVESGTDKVVKGSDDDARFWNTCYEKFYTSDPASRPLEQLDKALAGARPPCSAGGAVASAGGVILYPACRAMTARDVRRAAPRVVFQKLNRFQDLAACLAPMRHVLITFTSLPSASN